MTNKIKECCEKCRENPPSGDNYCAAKGCGCHNPLSAFMEAEEKEFEQNFPGHALATFHKAPFHSFLHSHDTRLLSKIQGEIEKKIEEMPVHLTDIRFAPDMPHDYIHTVDLKKCLKIISSLLQEAIKR